MTDIKFDSNDEGLLDQAVLHIEERVEILQEAEPYVIDMSAREATLSSYVGHTLDDSRQATLDRMSSGGGGDRLNE